MATVTQPKPKKFSKLLLIMLLVLVIVFVLGMIGYKYLFDIPWLDAMYYTAITTSTLDLPVAINNDRTPGQKVFIAVYALMAAIIFIGTASQLITSLIERYEN